MSGWVWEQQYFKVIVNEYFLSKKYRKTLFPANVGKRFGQAERVLIAKKGNYLSFRAKEFSEPLIQHVAGG
jgi:hypothetical protein